MVNHSLATEAIRTLLIAILSFGVALAITYPVIKILKQIKAGKQIRSAEAAPVFAKLHGSKAGTPTMGGVIIWGAVLLLALGGAAIAAVFGGYASHLNIFNRAETYLPIAAIVIAALLGLVDDMLGVLKIGPKGGGLPMRGKLIAYAIISAIGAWWFYVKLGWTSLYIPFLGNFEIGVWYIPIFMFIIVAGAFSANETDGLDGLLGGVALFAFGAYTVIAFSLGLFDLAALCAAMMGALLAFLWFNIYPAKFFMGDTGSMALGISLGVVAMLTKTPALLPLFMAIPVFESITVIIQMISKKTRNGKKIFLSTPIHHHFEAIGWPESQVTMRFWIISVMGVALGLALFFLDKFLK